MKMITALLLNSLIYTFFLPLISLIEIQYFVNERESTNARACQMRAYFGVDRKETETNRNR